MPFEKNEIKIVARIECGRKIKRNYDRKIQKYNKMKLHDQKLEQIVNSLSRKNRK